MILTPKGKSIPGGTGRTLGSEEHCERSDIDICGPRIGVERELCCCADLDWVLGLFGRSFDQEEKKSL